MKERSMLNFNEADDTCNERKLPEDNKVKYLVIMKEHIIDRLNQHQLTTKNTITIFLITVKLPKGQNKKQLDYMD
eukprot:snap_masked-scaffold_8-processed-gene-13.37-mRNA-1 protein AED:1.00 eAED:1.00 QI:0/-1/0/0/-1/1/1/0/74